MWCFLIESVSNNEYLPAEEGGNIINSGTAKLHKLQPEKQPDTQIVVRESVHPY